MAFKKAEREKLWVKVLLTGPSGSGKSYSALRLATGLAKACDSRIAAVDTENGRIRYYNQAEKREFSHPTVKPVWLIKNFIFNSTKPEDIIFDPFIGVGTTAVAAEMLGRRYVGFELKQKYCDTAFRRLRKDEESDC